MKPHRILTLMFFLLISGQIFAQNSKDYMIKEWERAKAYTKEYLDAMPESGYGLKPTPEMRSFAQQMLHLSDGNFGIGAAASGATPPADMKDLEKITDQSKANVSKITLASYDFVINAIKGMSEAQLNETVKLFGNFEMSKAQALAKVFEHQTHHRGQTTVYIRLAGAKPPQEKLF